ncbi:hypothetical protein ACFFU1_03305 [Algibacter miyuki]|uniref:Right handed beta helix domain-containing protein n=1 Tax=Algibacter miyuki TaxID=1306933 RepID=A0ABV5GWQ3_9FLAO|nr:hypothetical protein [Algibacter miyuki]MDN3665243.1 hypothetical protein [Algibacter miyuki]
MKTKLSILVMALLFVYQVNAQNVLTVDNTQGANAQYNSLQGAISAASAGDTIYVHASITSYGEVVINKQLTLIGFGHSDTDKLTYISSANFSSNSSNSKLSGFYVTGSVYSSSVDQLSGLSIENNYISSTLYFGNGGVDNVIIRGNVINAIGTNNNSQNAYTNTIITNNIITGALYVYNHDSTTIKNNIFSNTNGSRQIVNHNSSTGMLTVQNNIIYRHYYSTLGVNSAGVRYEYCLAYNRSSGNLDDLDGDNNLNNQNPLFVEDNDDALFSAGDDYHLKLGSPAIGAGANGVDIGLYDGTPFIFNNYGYSNGIPTVKITSITDRVATGENLSVTINTNAN